MIPGSVTGGNLGPAGWTEVFDPDPVVHKVVDKRASTLWASPAQVYASGTMVSESKQRKTKKERQPLGAKPLLSPEEILSIRDLYRDAIADLRLDVWQVNFLNHMNQLTYHQSMGLTEKELAKLQEVKDTVNFDRQDTPPPPIDLDGVEENGDPDGLPKRWDSEFPDGQDEMYDRLAEEYRELRDER